MSNVTLDNATRQHLRRLISDARRQQLQPLKKTKPCSGCGATEDCRPVAGCKTCVNWAQKKRQRERMTPEQLEQFQAREAERKRIQKQRHFCQCGCGSVVGVAKQTDRRRGWVKGEPIRFVQGHNTGARRRGLRWGQKEGRKHE